MTSCQTKKEYLRIDLNSRVTDTMPFCPYVWSADFLDKDSANNINIPGITNMRSGRLFFLQGSLENMKSQMKNSILVIQGVMNNKLMMGVDTNNNGSITEHELFDLNYENADFIKINNIEQQINNKVEVCTFFIKPVKNQTIVINSHKNTENDRIDFEIMPTYKYGEQVFGGKKYKIVLYANNNFSKADDRRSRIVIKEADEPFVKCTKGEPMFKVGDPISFDESLFKFDSIGDNGSYIVLSPIKLNRKKTGITKDYFAYTIKGTDIITGHPYSSDTVRKYILIDFWGTWCRPCLELTGNLKAIANKYDKNKLEILGIAFDSEVGDVKKYLEKESISWSNLFDSQKESVIVNRFKVDAFPTFLLIDKDGKIVIRGTTKEALLKIEDFLNKALVK